MFDTTNIKNILTQTPGKAEVKAVLRSAMRIKGLTLNEAAVLLKVEDPSVLQDIYSTAYDVKRRVFGDRIVLFAPLYLTNYCLNGCTYCGFRASNTELPRTALTPDDAVKEARVLEEMGFKRILLVAGEDTSHGIDYIIECVKAIYEKTNIRILHLNAAPMDDSDLREVKEAGVGVYQCFQETYDEETYKSVHPTGPKSDYRRRIKAIDSALGAGFKDVGIGALLGLYDMRFEVLSTISHSKYLFKNFGTHAHTISVPRLRPAEGSEIEEETDVPVLVTDEDFKLAVAVYRLALPSAGVVVSTRESAELREELLLNGASQFSAASKTEPGGYTPSDGGEDGGEASAAASETMDTVDKKTLKQFSTTDKRTIKEVMASIINSGSMPSLCTSCYRSGRVGEDFTERALSGEMKGLCEANSILTLKEFSLEQGQNLNGDSTLIDKAIARALEAITDVKERALITKKLKEIEDGKKDVRL